MGELVDTLQNYKLLADMISELSDLVETGIGTPKCSDVNFGNQRV